MIVRYYSSIINSILKKKKTSTFLHKKSWLTIENCLHINFLLIKERFQNNIPRDPFFLCGNTINHPGLQYGDVSNTWWARFLIIVKTQICLSLLKLKRFQFIEHHLPLIRSFQNRWKINSSLRLLNVYKTYCSFRFPLKGH